MIESYFKARGIKLTAVGIVFIRMLSLLVNLAVLVAVCLSLVLLIESLHITVAHNCYNGGTVCKYQIVRNH